MIARMTKAVVALFAGVLLTFSSQAQADESKREVDAEVDAALKRFHEHVKTAPELLQDAKAVLVMPDVKKAGLVGGGEWGEGAMQVDGKTIAYYRMRGGSAGLQIGYEKGDMVFVFLTDEAVNKFKSENQFTVGADADVTMVDKEADASADTLKSKSKVAGFAFGDKGLMAGVSVKGTKFKRVHPK